MTTVAVWMSVEALTVCINHQKTPAVDCVICDPMEG